LIDLLVIKIDVNNVGKNIKKHLNINIIKRNIIKVVKEKSVIDCADNAIGFVILKGLKQKML